MPYWLPTCHPVARLPCRTPFLPLTLELSLTIPGGAQQILGGSSELHQDGSPTPPEMCSHRSCECNHQFIVVAALCPRTTYFPLNQPLRIVNFRNLRHDALHVCAK